MSRKHSGELVRLATGLVGPFDAQDAVTDACLRSFQSRNWTSVINRRDYLYRSVLNQARSHHRSKWWTVDLSLTEDGQIAGITLDLYGP